MIGRAVVVVFVVVALYAVVSFLGGLIGDD